MCRTSVVALGTLLGLAGGCSDDSGGQASGSTASAGSTTTATDTSASAPTSFATETSGSTTDDGLEEGQFRFVVDDFEVPTQDTYYGCWDFTITVDGPTQLIGFSPIVDNGAYVHHFVLSLHDEPTGRPPGYSCFDIAGDTVWTWAPGQTAFMMPEDVGYLVGNTAGNEVHLRLQIHYNNPQQTEGQRDSSGFDLWTTRELRPNNAGLLVFGDIGEIEIPPGEAAYEHVMTCRSSLTAQVFESALNVFASTMHAHELGSRLWTEVWRDGQRVGEINRDDPFIFDAQIMRGVDFVLQPGDEIRNHCIYDSTGRTDVTFGGLGTFEEMCWNMVMYYPRIDSGFDFCSSSN